eukprot:3329520-Pleurochrysis_carterae.AAC.1
MEIAFYEVNGNTGRFHARRRPRELISAANPHQGRGCAVDGRPSRRRAIPDTAASPSCERDTWRHRECARRCGRTDFLLGTECKGEHWVLHELVQAWMRRCEYYRVE